MTRLSCQHTFDNAVFTYQSPIPLLAKGAWAWSMYIYVKNISQASILEGRIEVLSFLTK